MGPWRHQLGAVGGHIQQTRHVQRQIGLTPAGGRIRGVKTRLNQGLWGQIVQHHQLERITEVHAALLAAQGIDHQLVVVELQRPNRAEVVHHHAVIAGAAINLGRPGQGQGDEVVAVTRIDRVKAARQADLVVALATCDGVFTDAHVDDVGTRAANKQIVAIAALKAQAAARAADELVLASATARDAARRPTQNHKAVVTQAAVEVQQGRDGAAHVDRVIALAAVADDLFDAARRVGFRLAERAHREGVAALVDVEGLVDAVVIQVATAVAARAVAHVQVERAIAGQVADVGRRAPAPKVAARDAHAHDAHLRGHVGAGRGDVDLGAEAGQGDVDLEQAQVDLKVQRAPGGGGKTGTAAEQHAHAGVEVQRAQVDVDLGLAAHLEIAARVDEAADLHRQGIEEVQAPVKLQLENLVDHAHAARKIHAKGQYFDLADQPEVEQGVARNGLPHAAAVGQGHVGQRAGVDLQDRRRLDVQDGHAHRDIGFDVERKKWRVVGVHAKGGRALDPNFTKSAQVQDHVHGGLHAFAVDQQVDGPAQLDGADIDAGLAGDAQHERVQHHLGGRAFAVVEGAGDRVAPAHFLLHAGGVDLQQKAALDAEDAAAVDDGRARVGPAHFQAAIQARLVTRGGAVDHQADGARDAQRLEHGQVQHRSDAQLQRDLGIDLGNDDAEVALEVQRAAEQVQAAFACDGGIHAGPARVFARGVGADSEGVKTSQIPELLGNRVGDRLAKGVQAQVKLGIELGHRPQIQVGRHVHAQGHTTAVDHQQAGGVALHVEAFGADLHVHIGKGGQACAFADAEVQHAGHGDQAEHLDLRAAKDTHLLLVKGQDDGLGRVARLYRIARVPDVVVLVGIRVDLQTAHHQVGVHPAALGKVEGGRAERDPGLFKGHRARGLVPGVAGVDAGAQARVQVQSQVLGIEHQALGHAHQADVIDLGLHRHVQAHVYACQVNHQLFGNDHAQVQVANGQAHGLGVDGVGLFDAAVVVAVVEVAARLTALNGRHANEPIGIVDAYGQGGDDGLRAVAQGDGFAALFGESHRG